MNTQTNLFLRDFTSCICCIIRKSWRHQARVECLHRKGSMDPPCRSKPLEPEGFQNSEFPNFIKGVLPNFQQQLKQHPPWSNSKCVCILCCENVWIYTLLGTNKHYNLKSAQVSFWCLTIQVGSSFEPNELEELPVVRMLVLPGDLDDPVLETQSWHSFRATT